MMGSAFFDPDDFDTTTITQATSPTAPAPISSPVDREPVLTSTAEKPKFFDLKPVAASAIAKPAEPIRMPEPLTLPSDFPSFVAPEGMHVDLSDLAIGSDEPRTRRQLREIQKLVGSEVIDETPALSLETEIEYEPDLAEQIAEQEVNSMNSEQMFEVSPGLVIEPTTNSIIIDQVQDLTNYTSTVSETGEILTTGAIQLPIAISDNGTGEIQIIQEAAALDSAIQVDNSTGFINTIAPMRVTGVVNSISKFKVIPTNLKRGSSHPYLVLAAAVGMVALGGLVIAIFMLQIT
jgi:hypothetical protein